jgi:hemerythrin-like metal-binding protein
MLDLVFNQDLLTEHEGIDRQHEAMFAWARKILSTTDQINGDDLLRAINFLGTYVKYHFAAEEFMMEKYQYEKFKVHMAQHDRLRATTKEIQQGAAQGQAHPHLLARVHMLFQDWYVFHINEWDKLLSRFLRSKQPSEQNQELPSVEQLINAKKINLDGEEIDLLAIEVVAQERWTAAPKKELIQLKKNKPGR